MSRVMSVALLATILGCAAGPEDDPIRTVLLLYDRAPTVQDEAAVRTRGGTEVTRVVVADAITFRTSYAATRFSDLPGVLRSLDLGPDPDPFNSVFVKVVGDAPTSADTAFVSAAGARNVGILASNSIAAEMRLSAVPLLDENPRFTSVRLAADDMTPQ